MNNPIDELTAAVLGTLKHAVVGLETCQETPETLFSPVPKRLPITTPALYLTLLEAEFDANSSEYPLVFDTHWVVTVAVKNGQANHNAQRISRHLSLQAAQVLQGMRFGVEGVEPIRIERLQPISFDTELVKSLSAWELFYSQRVHIGKPLNFIDDQIKPEVLEINEPTVRIDGVHPPLRKPHPLG